MNKVLVIIDAQEDFTRGSLRNEEAIKALPTIHEIERFAEENSFEAICYTLDTHFNNYLDTLEGKNLPIEHCICGTLGHRLCQEVFPSKKFPSASLYKLEKYSFGYTYWGDLGAIIGSSEEIWICGFCTDICVSANFQIIKAEYPHVPITVISDACAGTTPEMHEAALKVMKSCQAKIVTWDKLK